MKKHVGFFTRMVFIVVVVTFSITGISNAAEQGGNDVVRITLPDGTVKTMDLATYEAYFSAVEQPNAVTLNVTLPVPSEHTDSDDRNQAAEKGSLDLIGSFRSAPALQDSGEQQDPIQQLHFGNTYFKQGDYARAEQWFRKAADQGNATAQNNLAYMFRSGRGVSQDFSQAAYWYQKAADQGHMLAQNQLGGLYHNGQGVEQDYSRAAQWFRKAAEQGDASSQGSLATLYQHGKGVGQDFMQAAHWYEKAAAQGEVKSQAHLGNLYYHGQGVSQDYSQSVYWYRKSAEQGNAIAQGWMGYMYDRGLGVSQNTAEAERWYQKAADNGNEQARQNLAKLQASTARSFQTVVPSGQGGTPYYRQQQPSTQQQQTEDWNAIIQEGYNEAARNAGGAVRDNGGGLWGARGNALPEYGLD